MNFYTKLIYNQEEKPARLDFDNFTQYRNHLTLLGHLLIVRHIEIY
jgi:hypothetical protein